MDKKQMVKLVHAFHSDARPPATVYNILTGEAGIMREGEESDVKWAPVVTVTPPHMEQSWYRRYCIRDWELLPEAYRTFIHERMHPIYVACFTLDMRSDTARVFALADLLCSDQGEGFSGYLLDALTEWSGTGDVCKAVREAIYEYVIERI